MCTICRDSMCKRCGRRLSLAVCPVCGRTVCEECSVQVTPVVRVCRECVNAYRKLTVKLEDARWRLELLVKEVVKASVRSGR